MCKNKNKIIYKNIVKTSYIIFFSDFYNFLHVLNFIFLTGQVGHFGR